MTEDVRKAIEQALERRAEREARRIRVDVKDGTVTLTGAVHSWAERKSVVAAARFTRGVQAIEDHLRTEPVLSYRPRTGGRSMTEKVATTMSTGKSSAGVARTLAGTSCARSRLT